MSSDWDRILDAAHVADAARRELRADLREQVPTLPHIVVEERIGNVVRLVEYVPSDRVLTLINGRTDGH